EPGLQREQLRFAVGQLDDRGWQEIRALALGPERLEERCDLVEGCDTGRPRYHDGRWSWPRSFRRPNDGRWSADRTNRRRLVPRYRRNPVRGLHRAPILLTRYL